MASIGNINAFNVHGHSYQRAFAMQTTKNESLQALIVDDFDSFRAALVRMLADFGIFMVDSVSSGEEALRLCHLKRYDLILCDQNLGRGKSGQQVLEVLRYQPSLNRDSLFMLISAESNKDIIMAAYDFEPDAYLTKPITTKTLGQRLERLLAKRSVLLSVYLAFSEHDLPSAIQLCRLKIDQNPVHRNALQKLLGRALLEIGNYTEAEELYRSVLEVRNLDWAMVGMASVKLGQGDFLGAQQWLDDVIQMNPLCLKAYDLLANIFEQRGDVEGQQRVLLTAVNLSPLSILRQQALGDVSLKMNDLATAAVAYKKAVKLGENSCYESITFHEKFIQTVIQLARGDLSGVKAHLRDALKTVVELPVRFGKTIRNKIMAYLLESQLQYVKGEEYKANELLGNAQKVMASNDGDVALDEKIELAKTLRLLGKKEECNRLIVTLLSDFAENEYELQKIDCLLDEPTSVKNKVLVKKLNQEGIDFFEKKNFIKAIASFRRALHDFPQHVGLRLNLIQALLEQAKMAAEKSEYILSLQQAIDQARANVPMHHAQYPRFRELESASKELLSKPLKMPRGL
jgi:CheY-like chemotaxis protein